MADHVYSVTEIVGTSHESLEDAIRGAIRTAGGTLRNLDWFEVVQIRGQIEKSEVAYFQVGLKIGFRYER